MRGDRKHRSPPNPCLPRVCSSPPPKASFGMREAPGALFMKASLGMRHRPRRKSSQDMRAPLSAIRTYAPPFLPPRWAFPRRHRSTRFVPKISVESATAPSWESRARQRFAGMYTQNRPKICVDLGSRGGQAERPEICARRLRLSSPNRPWICVATKPARYVSSRDMRPLDSHGAPGPGVDEIVPSHALRPLPSVPWYA